jgi:hypothetical protein
MIERYKRKRDGVVVEAEQYITGIKSKLVNIIEPDPRSITQFYPHFIFRDIVFHLSSTDYIVKEKNKIYAVPECAFKKDFVLE